MKPKKETIINLTACLNELNQMLKADNNTDYQLIKQITRKHNCDSAAFYYAVEAGLFKKHKRCIYSSLFDKIEPIMARRVYDLIRNRKEKNLGKQLSLKIAKGWAYKVPTREVKKIEQKEQPTILPQQKTFSLFWGLIKFNY